MATSLHFRPARTALLCALAGVGIVTVVLWWDAPHVPAAMPSAAANRATTERLVTEDLPAVEETVERQLREAGFAPEEARHLASVSRELFAGMLLSDFTRFSSQMNALGLDIGPFGEARLEKHRKYAYRDVDANWSAMSLRERARYVWEHPARRKVSWRAMHPEGVHVYVKPPAPPEKGLAVSGKLSWFAPANAYELIGQYQDGAARSAWVAVPMVMGTGPVTLRIQYIYDETRSAWLPIRIEAIAPQRHRDDPPPPSIEF